MKRLGVNIDHVATLRNARGEIHPDPVNAAKFVKKVGALNHHSFERRQETYQRLDAKRICSIKKLLVNLEISTNSKIVKTALKIKPDFICIVPEKRQEITTEGGLNLKKNKLKIKKILAKFKKKRIRTSLFINPSIIDVRISKELNTDCIEIHTGRLANLVKSGKKYSSELNKIINCSKVASQLGIEVHAGHGLDYKTTKLLKNIKEIKEFNIGHYLIGESIFFGLSRVIKNFKRIIKK